MLKLKPTSLSLSIFLLLTFFGICHAEEKLTITTYYPSPYGSYADLTANRMKIGSTYSGSATSFVSNGLIVEGSVGIGTTDPQSVLHVEGQAYIAVRLGIGVQNPSPHLQVYSRASNTNSQVVIGSLEAGEAYGILETGDTNRYFRLQSVSSSGSSFGNIILNDAGGNVGIGTTSPTLGPLQMGSGAYVTSGGVWTDASSRAYKQDIAPLGLDKAMKTLTGLQPVTFRYKRAPDEQHVGFISEDVPELVVTKDRTGLSAMDIVAVLTKVVQQQQKEIETLKQEMSGLKRVL